MKTAEIHHQIKEYIDCLSSERLKVAIDFLAYLVERESQEATEELLNIPTLINSLEKAEEEISTGRYKNWRSLDRDV